MREDIDEVLGRVFDALSNRFRRLIIRVLAEEGSLGFTELMRSCGIRDSSTLKHHLSKLEGLVVRNDNGFYELTPLGKEAYELLHLFTDSLSRLVPMIRNPSPVIVIKPSLRHLITSALILAVISCITVALTQSLAALVPITALLALVTYIIARHSRKVLISREYVIEVSNSPISTCERRLVGKLVGIERGGSTFLKILGLEKLNLILNVAGGVRTYSVGYVSRRAAVNYVRDLEALISASAQTWTLSH